MFGLVDQIAKDYLRRVRIKQNFISAACPFHKGGQERRPSFWLSRQTGGWGCFTCSAGSGDLKELLRLIGIHNSKVEVAIEEAQQDASNVATIEKAKQRKKAKAEFKAVHTLPDAVLGVFDFVPLDLVDAGYPETLLIQHDIGFDHRSDRITFPIRDYEGTLVGISGRSVRATIPKYLIYSGRRVIEGKEVLGELGEWYPEYSNDGVRDHLWRIQSVYPELINSTDGQLIIVEGFKAALWLVLHDWTNVVALMGTKMTFAQERMIRRLGAETFVFLDNNEPGREASREICQRLAVSTFPVYECHYPDYFDENAQPDDLTEAEVEGVLSNSKRAGGKHVVGLRSTRRLPKGTVFKRQK